MTRCARLVALMWLLIATLAPARQLPWISVNHLHGITGLEELDPALYEQLAKGETEPQPPRHKDTKTQRGK